MINVAKNADYKGMLQSAGNGVGRVAGALAAPVAVVGTQVMLQHHLAKKDQEEAAEAQAEAQAQAEARRSYGPRPVEWDEYD